MTFLYKKGISVWEICCLKLSVLLIVVVESFSVNSFSLSHVCLYGHKTAVFPRLGGGVWNADCCHNSTKNILFFKIITFFVRACVLRLQKHITGRFQLKMGRKSARSRGFVLFPLHYRLLSRQRSEAEKKLTPLI